MVRTACSRATRAQRFLGLTPLQAGLWGLPAGLGFVAGSLLTSALLKILRPALALGLGLMVAASGLTAMACAVDAHSLILITLGNTLFAIGSAPGTAIVADFVVSSAPEEQSGAASALSETVSEFGGALGIALLGSLATFLYRHALVVTLPSGMTAESTDTALRRIGAASALARSLSNGSDILAAAKHAYTGAAATAFATSAGLTVLTAIIAVRMFGARKSNG